MENNALTPPPFIIGISGISGAGKTTLTHQLAEELKATSIFWDDYEKLSQSPKDLVAWSNEEKNYDEWIYSDLSNTLKGLKEGKGLLCPATKKILHPTQYILFDAPFGYSHQETGQHIDFLIFLDTPIDIALARRLLKKHRTTINTEAIMDDLNDYLNCSRSLFTLSPKEKIYDIHLDGSLSLQDLSKKALAAIKHAYSKQNISKIDIHLQPVSTELKEQIDKGLGQHAISTLGYNAKFSPAAFVARSKQGHFMGAIVIELFWGSLHIRRLYVEEEFRNGGVGSLLMEYALEYSKSYKCSFITVETMGFQALEFYQKIGFTLELTRSGYKHNTCVHYLRKNL